MKEQFPLQLADAKRWLKRAAPLIFASLKSLEPESSAALGYPVCLLLAWTLFRVEGALLGLPCLAAAISRKEWI